MKSRNRDIREDDETVLRSTSSRDISPSPLPSPPSRGRGVDEGSKSATNLSNVELESVRKGYSTRAYIPERVTKYPFYPIGEESAGSLFKAYFQNKVAVILLLLQMKRPVADSLGSMKAVIFFDDLYRHLLASRYQRDYARIFKWLKLFFKRFPYVKPVQKRKAIEYIKVIYQLFGFEWKLRI